MRKALVTIVAGMCIALSACAPVLIGGAGAGGYYVGKDKRSMGTITRDAAITAEINAKYVGDKIVKARNINVDTYNGAVTLQGNIDSNRERDRAVSLAKNVKGVASVSSKIVVLP